MNKFQRLCFVAASVIFGVFGSGSLSAARFEDQVVEFTGAAGDGELSNPANWSAPLTADSTAAITANSIIPATGLKLTGTLTAGFFRVYAPPAKDITIDISNGDFNIPDIRVGDVPGNGKFLISGGADNLTNIYVKGGANLVLTNGIYKMDRGNFYCYNWNGCITVAKDAEFILGTPAANRCSGTYSGNTGLVVDGGKVTIAGYADSNWSTIRYGQNFGQNYIRIINGGEYYEATTPQFEIYGDKSNFLLVDSSYISTNSTGAARNMMVACKNSFFAVTNSTLKVAQIYGGTLYDSTSGWYFKSLQEAVNSVFTFHNSNVDLAFPDGSGYAMCSGFFLASNATKNVVLLDGPNGVFKTQNLLIAGKTNSFEIADGTLEVSKRLQTGTLATCGGIGNSLKFSGGTSKVKQIHTEGGIDSTIEICGTASLDVSNEVFLDAPGSVLKVTGGKFALEDSDYVKLTGPDTRYEITGGTTTSRVSFLSHGCRFFVGNGATAVGIKGSKYNGTAPVMFNEGSSGNVFVISNATFESHMGFTKALVITDEGPKQEAVPFTNCPNSRIEFQGESPRFRIHTASRYGSEEPWYAAAFGCSWIPGKLKDVLRIRYVLPENAYAEAPIQVLGYRSVWGGNAEFEFDASNYKWPAFAPVKIPLVYDAGSFKGWNHRLYIDVDGLNETNAERLPVCPKSPNIKARLVLSEDGKTLCLYMPGYGGTLLTIR
jgi:hypothetical protein